MLAIIVLVFMINCMSYRILSYIPLFQVARNIVHNCVCIHDDLSYPILSFSTLGGFNVGHNCACIHDNLYVLSNLILSYLSLYQVVRMLAIIVVVFMITCVSYLILVCLIFLYFRWFECWP